MNREIKIGASISNRTDASEEVENVFSASEFPRSLNIQNHMPTRLVLPELKALDIAPMTSCEAHFSDIGLLKRVVSSLAQIARLNKYPELATVYALEISQVAAPVEATTTTTQDSGEIYAQLIQELDGGYLLVAVGDVQFQIRNTQLRDDGSLTAGGVTAYETALTATNE